MSVLAVVLAAAQLWLGASDIHLDPFDASPTPSAPRSDTNGVLFASALQAMRRAVADPAVVVLPGDFFMHHFPRPSARPATIREVAAAFARAFPRAQFVVALGNNDSACGDYRSELGSPDLRALARAWSPLVDRNGAAPDFERTFAASGHYVARLPGGTLRAVVVDAIPFSSLYRGDCRGAADAGVREIAWLRAALAATPRGVRNVVVLHVPPGYDVFATEFARGFVPWPLMQAQFDRQLVVLLSDPRDRVAFVVAGHEHHFDLRLDGRTPIVALGSISPVYRNAPAFYALDVDGGGTLRDVRAWTFDDASARWSGPHDFDRDWDAAALDAPAIRALHERLASDERLRERWELNSNGWAPVDPDDRIWGSHWRIPWCAQTVFDASFAACAGLTGRIAAARIGIAALAAAVAASIVGLVFWLRRRRTA